MNALVSITALSAAALILMIRCGADEVSMEFKMKHPEFVGRKINVSFHLVHPYLDFIFLLTPILNTIVLVYAFANYGDFLDTAYAALEDAFARGLISAE